MKTPRSLLVLLLLGGGACVDTAPLTNLACPCADGWKCCEGDNVCVPEDTGTCPAPDPGPPQRLDLDDAAIKDNFGSAVAIAGDVLAVGVPGRDTAAGEGGTVILYERRGAGEGTWIRLAELTQPESEANAAFGTAVAFAGDRLLVGAPRAAGGTGRVYVYTHDVTGWVASATIAPDLSGVPANAVTSVGFGGQVAADDTRAVIAAALGWADVYELTDAQISPRVRLRPPAEDGVYFSRITLDGTSVATLSRGVAPSLGAVHVFDERDGWAPVRVAELTTSYPVETTPALHGDRLAVACDTGTICVYERGAEGWGPAQTVLYGQSVPKPGERATALSWQDDRHLIAMTTTSRGLEMFSVWQLQDGRWVGQTAADADDLGDATPTAVAFSAPWLVIGTPSASDAGEAAGAIDLFRIQSAVYPRIHLTLDEGSLTYQMIVSGGRNLLAATINGSTRELRWFRRDENGMYHRRPSLVVEPGVFGVAVDDRVAIVHGVSGLQLFDLGDTDWTVGQHIPASKSVSFHPSIAIDGDVMVVAGSDAAQLGPEPVGLVYERTAAGWIHTASLPVGNCGVGAPKVFIKGDKILVECGRPYPVELWFFTRVGGQWMPMPSPVFPEPLGGGSYDTSLRSALSGDRYAVTWRSALQPYTANVQHVFHWLGDRWELELTRTLEELPDESCRTGCGATRVVAIDGDQLVLGRDLSSVARYAYEGGTWVETGAFELPAQARSAAADIQQAMIADDRLLLVVPHEAGRLSESGAVYSFPWH